MVKAARYLAQILAYGLFAGVLGYFSDSPAYVHQDPEQALIKLSFRHAGEHKVECRRRTPEEIAALAPNMRRPFDCPRARISLVVELVMDGKLLYHGVLPPSGLAGDGASTVYQRFLAEPGRHHLIARLRDSRRERGFDYEHEEVVALRPRQNFVVDFQVQLGGFVFR